MELLTADPKDLTGENYKTLFDIIDRIDIRIRYESLYGESFAATYKISPKKSENFGLARILKIIFIIGELFVFVPFLYEEFFD